MSGVRSVAVLAHHLTLGHPPPGPCRGADPFVGYEVALDPSRGVLHGRVPLADDDRPTRPALIAGAGETQSFQIAVLPRMGAAPGDYAAEVTLENAPGAAAQLFREDFVKTSQPGYPRHPVDRWPDPLVPVAAGQTLPITGG